MAAEPQVECCVVSIAVVADNIEELQDVAVEGPASVDSAPARDGPAGPAVAATDGTRKRPRDECDPATAGDERPAPLRPTEPPAFDATSAANTSPLGGAPSPATPAPRVPGTPSSLSSPAATFPPQPPVRAVVGKKMPLPPLLAPGLAGRSGSASGSGGSGSPGTGLGAARAGTPAGSASPWFTDTAPRAASFAATAAATPATPRQPPPPSPVAALPNSSGDSGLAAAIRANLSRMASGAVGPAGRLPSRATAGGGGPPPSEVAYAARIAPALADALSVAGPAAPPDAAAAAPPPAPSAVKAVAAAVATAVAALGDASPDKLRQLLGALKDAGNAELRAAVLDGRVPPDRLVAMSDGDLANPEAKRRAAEEFAERARHRNWTELKNSMRSTTTLFRCPKCGKRDCSMEQRARRGDEPMVVVLTCNMCNCVFKR